MGEKLVVPGRRRRVDYVDIAIALRCYFRTSIHRSAHSTLVAVVHLYSKAVVTKFNGLPSARLSYACDNAEVNAKCYLALLV